MLSTHVHRWIHCHVQQIRPLREKTRGNVYPLRVRVKLRRWNWSIWSDISSKIWQRLSWLKIILIHKIVTNKGVASIFKSNLAAIFIFTNRFSFFTIDCSVVRGSTRWRSIGKSGIRCRWFFARPRSIPFNEDVASRAMKTLYRVFVKQAHCWRAIDKRRLKPTVLNESRTRERARKNTSCQIQKLMSTWKIIRLSYPTCATPVCAFHQFSMILVTRPSNMLLYLSTMTSDYMVYSHTQFLC